MRDELVRNGPWEFDESVSEVFQDMLSRSIPDYVAMRDLTFRIARSFVIPHSRVLDVGCSTGLSSKSLVEYCAKNGLDVTFDLVDVSEAMLERCREKYVGHHYVNVLNHNVATIGLPHRGYSVVIACLTLQFIPIEYRQKVIEDIYDALLPGGVLIMIEKVLGNSSIIDSFMVSEHYDIKRENSYTEEQISSKRRSLEGRLVPLTAKMNEALLETAGFRNVDTFWRYLNFCGWLAIK